MQLNTNYLKVHNVARYEEIAREKVDSPNISDLPVEIAKEKKSSDAFEKYEEGELLLKKAAVVAFSHCDRDRAVEKMRELVRDYLTLLAGEGKFKKL